MLRSFQGTRVFEAIPCGDRGGIYDSKECTCMGCSPLLWARLSCIFHLRRLMSHRQNNVGAPYPIPTGGHLEYEAGHDGQIENHMLYGCVLSCRPASILRCSGLPSRLALVRPPWLFRLVPWHSRISVLSGPIKRPHRAVHSKSQWPAPLPPRLPVHTLSGRIKAPNIRRHVPLIMPRYGDFRRLNGTGRPRSGRTTPSC